MTPKEALELLDRVLANINGTRADHARIVEALQVISKALETKDITIQDPKTSKP